MPRQRPNPVPAIFGYRTLTDDLCLLVARIA
jgi:hypothetical protein